MAKLDPNALINSIKDAAGGILQQDVTTVTGFAQDQLTGIAQQAERIAAMEAMGVFKDNDELRDHFVNNLEAISRNFVLTLEGLAALTAEKLWNAIVGIVWDAIGTATGVALPLPVAGLFA